MDIDAVRDQLEPYYGNLDHIVEDVIKPSVKKGIVKYFECCRFKLKTIWYTDRRIHEWDEKYKEYLSECISSNAVGQLSLTVKSQKRDTVQCYFPFYEAIEFENILSQGKACLDCFSKALGSMYDQSGANNISKLQKVLESNRHKEKVDELLDVVSETNRLLGVLIDPKAGKKSIRDLINHRERVNIYFSLRENNGSYTLSHGALLDMDHPEIPLLRNYLVTNISAKIHTLLSGVIEKSFRIQFGDL